MDKQVLEVAGKNRCDCKWTDDKSPKVIAREYRDGVLCYELAQCPICGGKAWELRN